jgi:hypothetical protein
VGVPRVRGLGAKPHKKDDRDWLLRDVNPAKLVGFQTGKDEDGGAGLTIVRRLWKMHAADFRIDQGQEGTCVGHGTTNMLAGAPLTHLNFAPFADTQVAHTFSRQLYFDITSDSTYQQGANPRDAMQWCLSKGYAAAYYRLVDTDDIIDFLLNHGPVGFCSPWYASMDNVRGDGSYTKLPYLRVDPSSGIRGYHWYVLSGIDLAPEDGRAPRVRMWNSWGPWWGLNGCAAIEVYSDLPILYEGSAYVLTETVF